MNIHEMELGAKMDKWEIFFSSSVFNVDILNLLELWLQRSRYSVCVSLPRLEMGYAL